MSWIVLGCAGCVGWTPLPDEEPTSLGTTSHGVLVKGVPLRDEGPGYHRIPSRDDARWGTPELVGLLQRTAASVAERFPGTVPVRIGDLSRRGGGWIAGHDSHRTGRDADVLFYATDALGRPVATRGWPSFGRFGVARRGRRERAVFFDAARNWHFVRTLLLDDRAAVQWIFCSAEIKARLLRHAVRHEASAEALFRAAWVLHEPDGSQSHADHFHVRIACTPAQRARGCRDHGPIWPWIRDAVGKPAGAPRPALTDAELLRALLSEDGGIEMPERRPPARVSRAARK